MQGRKEDKGTQEVSGSNETRQGVVYTNSNPNKTSPVRVVTASHTAPVTTFTFPLSLSLLPL